MDTNIFCVNLWLRFLDLLPGKHTLGDISIDKCIDYRLIVSYRTLDIPVKII